MGAILAGVLAADARAWAPAATAEIRPGVRMFTEGSGCTSNFFFRDRDGAIYLGYAAHCAAKRAGGTVQDVCSEQSLPLETKVQIEGAARPGRLAYSSYGTMRALAESDPRTCSYNDFALVRLHPADVPRANPTVPFWGGPTGMRRTTVAAGEKVMSYGNSQQRGETEELRLREGYGSGLDLAEGWSHRPYMVNPTWFGDSGSGFMDAAGGAFGVLSTLGVVPPGASGVIDLGRALDYARERGGMDVRLVPGTEPFTGPVLGPGVVGPPEPEPVSPFEPRPEAPAPPAAAPATADTAVPPPAPRVRIRSVRGRMIRGTASGEASRVEVAVARRGQRLRWRRAAGTRAWKLRLRSPLPRGRHLVHARAFAADGSPGPVERRVARVRGRS